MNIKFRMPRFGNSNTNSNPKSMFREIALTTIATSISIILTFGTAHFIEVKHKKNAGRQTAMMVIHDMENSIKYLRDIAKDEEKYRKMTEDVLEHMENIDSLDVEKAWEVFIYISSTTDKLNLYRLDDSSERVFLSSQDSWKNIDNAAFIDAVQEFYTYRHEIFDYINASDQYQKPIGSDVIYQHQLNHEDASTNIHEILKQTLPTKEVRYYLNYSSGRQMQLNQFADQMQHYSDVCKFNMGITDEELEEYVRKTKRTGRNLEESELIGRWIKKATDEENSTVEFFKDHTFTQTDIAHISHPMYNGRVDTKYTLRGTWELNDDTLNVVFKPHCKFTMDYSHITPKPGCEQNVKAIIERYRKHGQGQEQLSLKSKDRPCSYAATISTSGKKIELKWMENDQEQSLYLSRDNQ